MKKTITTMATLLFLSGCGNEGIGLTATALAKEGGVTDADMPLIKKLIKEDLPQAFMEAMQSTKRFESILTKDAKLKWPNRQSQGRDAFIGTIVDAFKEDGRLFTAAVNNFKFLSTKCGIKDETKRPVGLPKSVDVSSFNPANITPDLMRQHPGLMAPSIEIIKDLQGQSYAANRFIIIAKFKHGWMQNGHEPYLYVDRFVVERENGKLRIAEYEFTANLSDIPAKPTPLTKCP